MSQKSGFSEMVKKVGKILMLYLEGLYCDRLIEDGKFEQKNNGGKPRKLRKML